jgi:hypothetical protein
MPEVVFLDRQTLPQIAQQQRDEDVIGRDIEQRSFPRALTDRCEGAGVVAFAVEAHPFDLHRQHVTGGHTALG